MATQTTIELLAPAGNWDCARAAVENGADAIYFGLDAGFNARARAANFHLKDLPRLMDMLHRQAVRGYVTLNTLVFTDELPALEENVRHIAQAGVDAVLVQDLGVAQLVRTVCPELEIHASTQMTLTHAASVNLVRDLGIQRVVLARELSLREIDDISTHSDMPLETFVHGALCVAYSGQCLTSESFGGRSANRGQCAQACRLPYDLVCDGQPRDLGPVKYLLSPQDLAAHDLVPQLIEAGVCSLKVEGRLKTPEYVANVCSHYRAAIDAALSKQTRRLTETQQRELELSFSRGFSPGWLEGCDHKRLVPGRSSSKRGVLLGNIVSHRGDSIEVNLQGPVTVGDGVVIAGDRFAGEEFGGRVYEIQQRQTSVRTAQHGHVRLALQRGSFAGKTVAVGQELYKTDDPQLTKRLRKSFAGGPRKRVPVDLQIRVAAGEPIEFRATSLGPDGPSLVEVEISSEHVPEVARKHPLTEETLREQFSRLGKTVYRLEQLRCQIIGRPMLPLSVLGQLRKQLVAKLDAARSTPALSCARQPQAERLLARVHDAESADDPNSAVNSPKSSIPATLRVLCRSMEHIEQTLASGIQHVIADFQDIRQYRQAVAAARSAGAEIELATLRIHKPGEDGLFRSLAKQSSDAWLVRNLAALQYCRQERIPFATDFSLNVTNPLTAGQLRRWGASRVTASYDLNRDQLIELTEHTPAHWLEVVIHQHMPMFHMEHCVFCSVLSPGKNKSDCGRPCDRHQVELRDRVGAAHVLHADIGCRNTLYNATAQSGAEAVALLLEMGVRQFRVELLKDMSNAAVRRLVELYQALLLGQLSGSEVWRELKADNRIGVTRGTLEQPRNPLAIL